MSTVALLLGRRITVREWRGDDLDAFHRWIGNPTVMRYLTWDTTTRDDSAAQLAAILREQRCADRQPVLLTIELTTPQRVIGDSGFTWIPHRPPRSAIFWSRPIGGKAMRPKRLRWL